MQKVIDSHIYDNQITIHLRFATEAIIEAEFCIKSLRKPY